MAAQAPVAVEPHRPRPPRLDVRVVTRDAARPPATTGEAPAHRHLLEVADDLAVVGDILAEHEGGDELVPRQPGSILKRRTPSPGDLLAALQMALPANVRLEVGRQVFRVDNRAVEPRRSPTGLALGDVQRPRPVTALAADADLDGEQRLAKAVLGPRDRLDPVGVAEQAAGGDRPSAALTQFGSGRQVPAAIPGEP